MGSADWAFSVVVSMFPEIYKFLNFNVCPQHALKLLRNALKVCPLIYTALNNKVCSIVTYGYEM